MAGPLSSGTRSAEDDADAKTHAMIVVCLQGWKSKMPKIEQHEIKYECRLLAVVPGNNNIWKLEISATSTSFFQARMLSFRYSIGYLDSREGSRKPRGSEREHNDGHGQSLI